MKEKSKSEKEKLIPVHGGYRKLKSFQIAQLIYDVTVRFCEKYVSRFSRTQDQMVQAARLVRHSSKAKEEAEFRI